MRSRAWMDWENIELNSLLEPSVPLWLRNQVKRQAISIIDCLASVGTRLRHLATMPLNLPARQSVGKAHDMRLEGQVRNYSRMGPGNPL